MIVPLEVIFDRKILVLLIYEDGILFSGAVEHCATSYIPNTKAVEQASSRFFFLFSYIFLFVCTRSDLSARNCSASVTDFKILNFLLSLFFRKLCL